MFDPITMALSDDGGLSVVELETNFEPNIDGALTAEESAKLSEAMATGLPIAVKILFNNQMHITSVCQILDFVFLKAFMTQIMIPDADTGGSYYVILLYEDPTAGVWVYEINEG